jgi:hypothetical protein
MQTKTIKKAITKKIEQWLVTITDENWGFVQEKRLRILVDAYHGPGLVLTGMFYVIKTAETAEEMLEYLNTYNETPESGKARYHRLLTHREIDFVLKKMHDRNY